MGKRKKKCGCYDGPYSSATPTILISVRCEKHVDVPPLANHSLSHLMEDGTLVSISARYQEKKKEHPKTKRKGK